MTASNYAASETLVIAHEGGYVNNPKDPGGPTNKGVTQAVYDRHRKAKQLPVQSVKLISDAEVSTIYKDDYWDVVSGDKLPTGIDYATFDFCVNSGASEAVKVLQRCVNAKQTFFGVPNALIVDGIIGQSTVSALEMAAAHGAETLIEDYCNARIAFMKTLSTWKTFGTGWQRRVEGAHADAQDDDDGVVDLAVKMANATAPVTVVAPAEAAAAVATAAQPGAAPTVVLVAPSPVGARAGEAGTAKAFPAQIALLRTVQGAGVALASAGVTGNTALDAAKTVRGSINGSVFGQLALILFVLLMLAGIGLILVKFYQDHNEKKA